MTSTSPFTNTPYYDPFFDTFRAFIRGDDVTWEEVEKADGESRQVADQRYVFLRRLEDGLGNPETSSQVRDLLLAMPIAAPLRIWNVPGQLDPQSVGAP